MPETKQTQARGTRYCARIGCGKRFFVEPDTWAIYCPEHEPVTTQQHSLRCAGCGRIDCVTAPSAADAAAVLVREGWIPGDETLLCPVCAAIPWRRDRFAG